MVNKSDSCPCGSGKKFGECCEPVITLGNAKTAEALMRSRYSAYVVADVDYIMKTTAASNRSKMDASAILKWATESDWKSLEILNTENGLEGDEKGKVEFIANYRENGVLQKYHEIGTFTKESGIWFYSDSEIPMPKQVVREAPKVGRNDPCVCGSGKKYKKCCGKAK